MKLYFEAEKFLKPSNNNNGSLQSRIFNDTKLTNSPKHIYAVVYSTLKYKPYINIIIQKSKIKQSLQMKKLKISDELLQLLIHDLLFSSKGRIQSGKHPIKDAFLSNKTRLQAEFTKLKLKYKAKSVSELPTKEADEDETPVRWFRINTIKIDPASFFKKYPFFQNLQPVSTFQELTTTGMLYTDDYIPNLFGIYPREKITSTEAYKNGHIIIQDRASCFPSHILNQDPSDIHHEVIDACAAPGNKTTHAASYLPTPESVVYAFERDAKRVEILKTMCDRATGKTYKSLIQITHADFLTTSPQDFTNVTGLIVDPSCSGSGIFGRALEDSEQQQQEVDTARLNKLAAFQFKIVKHAMQFPKARKVVYSTCSIHAEENEKVVIDLLNDAEIKKQGWCLAPREIVIPEWERRGWEQEFSSISGDEEERKRLAGGCVRANPKEDGGIGFFAACFIKQKGAKNNKKKESARQNDQKKNGSKEDKVEDGNNAVDKMDKEEQEAQDEWSGFED
ncbi:uncharacterized protein J8A68_003666 [[Candida] subhashii]|uniref:SAM-dependent MTase RsmB/NOP-type domain-containing protein n=1 Tax=[Candida] subhashii TaxID=561895 RepID=A0A8J5QM22_9ASCO|nr:uncharacterized protein J8A68_003666 [[Candida] subhashii]KAG7662812.1 hypothetical protein J8A68_003666 [[Candida] subhashii]